MKTKSNPFIPSSSRAAVTVLAAMVFGLASHTSNAQTTGFLQTAAGTYDYNAPGNWVGGTINGIWDSSLTIAGIQIATFAADTSLPTGLTFNHAGNFAMTLRSDAVANHAVTLGGDISVAGTSTAAVTIGSTTALNNLNVDLGGVSRSVSVNTGRTLTLTNVVSNGSINKTGAGILVLSGANAFSGGLTLSAGQVTFGNIAAMGAGTFTIMGGTTLNVSTAINSNTNNNVQNWNGDFTFTGSNTLNLGTGAVTMNGSRTVTVSASTLTVGGAIGESGSGFSLTKAGAGTMVLNGANTYSGGTIINAGVLTVGAAGTLGSNVSGNNVTINGGILNLGATANIGANQTLTLSSSPTVLSGLGLAFNALPAFTPPGSGPMLFAINTTGFDAITSQSTVGTGNDFLGSTGTGTFSGASLGAGLDGTYRLGGGGGTLTVTNAVLTGASPLIIGSTLTNGGGTVVLQGANTLSGATSVNAGTLKLSGTSGSLASSTVTVTGQAVLNLDSSTSGVTGTTRAAAVNLRGGSLTLNGNSGAASADTISGAINIDGNSSVNGINYITLTPNAGKNASLSASSLTRSNGGAVQISGTNLGAAPANGVANFTLTTPPTLSGTGTSGTTSVMILPWAIGSTTVGNFSDFITYDTNGFRPLTSSEYINFTATGSFTGTATGDNVKITSTTPAVTMTLSAPTTVNSLYMSTSSSSTTLTGSTITVASGAVFLTNGNAGVTIASNLDFGAAQGVVGFGRGKATTISGNISGSGGLILYQVAGPPATGSGGTGIALTGTTSTYTGDTYVIGRVDLSNNVLPNSANGARGGNIYDYGMLNFNGNALTINGLYGDGIVNDNNSGVGTLTVGDNNADGDFSGTITENAALSLIKIGSGTQKITSAISITGATIIRGGVLEAATLANGGVASGIGSSASTAANLVINGGTLKYTGAATSTDRLFKVGETTTGGTATIDASGTGAINFTNTGAITYGTAGSTGTAQIRSLVLTGTNTGDNTLSAVIGNNGIATNGNSAVSVTKNGIGKWILSGANTYTGNTTVSGGTLSLGQATLADASIVYVATSAVLNLTHGLTDTVDSFYINGVQQAAGEWGATGSGAAHQTARITGSGKLNATNGAVSSDPFDAWIDTFTSLTAPADKTKAADPDHDGLSNVAEFALDGNPASGVASGKVRSRVETVGADQALVITLPVRASAAFDNIPGPAADATIDNLIYTIEGSNDLVTFNQGVTEISVSSSGMPALTNANWTYRTFRLNGAVGGVTPRGPKGFLRAVIVGTP